MIFKLDNKNGVPIYVQLKNEIKYSIASGTLTPGAQLPTVRQLAVDLKVNVNTVGRVYSELEKEGLLSTRKGKGTYVCERDISLHEQKNDRLEQIIDKLFIDTFELGYRPEELLEHIRRRLPTSLQEK